MEYAIIRDAQTGKVSAVVKIEGSGGVSFGPRSGELWTDFLAWNSQQPVPFDLTDKVPQPPPVDPDLALAVQILKAIPDSWKNGTNDQKISWATKRALKELRQELTN